MSKSKARGTKWETAVRDYFREKGWGCERIAGEGKNDRGDLRLEQLPITLELKNTKSIDLAGALTEAETEARRAGNRWFAAIIKRPRKGQAKDGYAVMPLWVMEELLTEAAHPVVVP